MRRKGHSRQTPPRATHAWRASALLLCFPILPNPPLGTNVREGRQSTITLLSMPSRSRNKLDLLQGTLDMLILRTLLFGPAHGHGISTFIQQTTRDALSVEHGSLYPALHRLQRNGWIEGTWEMSPDRNREYKYYRLTPLGRKQLAAEQSKWDDLVRAIERVMRPLPEE